MPTPGQFMAWYTDRTAPRVGDLCPACFKPSLKRLLLQRVDLAGVTTVGSRLWCRDERRFVAGFVPAPEPEEAQRGPA